MALLDDKYKKSRNAISSTGADKAKEQIDKVFTSTHTQQTQIDNLNTLQNLKSSKADVVKGGVNTIKGVKLTTEVIRVFSLDKKQGLEGILISHHDISAGLDATFSLVWSEGNPSELTIPSSGGVIATSTVTGGTAFRIITTTIPNNSSFMLPSDLIDKFEFVNKKINFYATSSIVGVEMTIFTK
tara:strand:+ start:3366 stop:3920 length:555 start_codon:yes stop_codon:yes gene_type:complete